MVQLPSSYRVSTAWFRETVERAMDTSQFLLRPMTFSQWVTGTRSPPGITSQAQISGSRRKVISGMAQRSSSRAARMGQA